MLQADRPDPNIKCDNCPKEVFSKRALNIHRMKEHTVTIAQMRKKARERDIFTSEARTQPSRSCKMNKKTVDIECDIELIKISEIFEPRTKGKTDNGAINQPMETSAIVQDDSSLVPAFFLSSAPRGLWVIL